MTAEEAFPRHLRIRAPSDFGRIFRDGAIASDATLVVRAARNGQLWPRLGISVPRRTGNAPQRNRWKRLIREAFRQQRTILPAGIDLMVTPRRHARCDFALVRDSLRTLARALRGKLAAAEKRAPRPLPPPGERASP